MKFFKSHPAKNARIMAGWATLTGTLVTGVAVVNAAVPQVDYTEVVDQLGQSQNGLAELSGQAEPMAPLVTQTQATKDQPTKPAANAPEATAAPKVTTPALGVAPTPTVSPFPAAPTAPVRTTSKAS